MAAIAFGHLRTVALLALAVLLSPTALSAAASDPDAQQLARDGRRFAVDLYGRLAATPGNVLVSPWSIRTALQMCYAGARARTEQQMSTALHDSLGQSRLHVAASRLDAELQAATVGSTQPPRVELLTANAVWIAADLRLAPAFADTLKARYAALPRAIDFGNSESARSTINDWVEQRTRSRIRDLIPQGGIDGHTRMTLCDAIYFRSAWRDSFHYGDTKAGLFHLLGGGVADVPFMHDLQDLPYTENDDLQVLELPYAAEDIVLLVVLPRANEGVTALDRKLDPDSLSAWVGRLGEVLVRVTLPRFRIEDRFRLASTLAAMGMTDAFDTARADFSGITAERTLAISEVFHRTYLALDEHGTEAAAATAVDFYRGGRGDRVIQPTVPVTFTADHPFLFLIYHRTSGAVLFMGRLVDPR